MEAKVTKIGNSKGIRLPRSVLKQCGIESSVELEVKDGCIIIKPIKSPRRGWDEAFRAMHKNGDDSLLISDELDNDLLENWDE